MLSSLCHIFWNTFRDLETSALLTRETPLSLESTLKTIESHRQILNAIRANDGQLASRLMFEHFGKIERSRLDAGRV